MRVCLIEDDEIMGESLVDRFQLEGIGVEWFRTGESAAKRLVNSRFDIVLSDIQLPDVQGDALYQRLVGESIDIPPFVFVTAYGDIGRAVDALKLGAADYICKPFNLEELLTKLARFARIDPTASNTQAFANAHSPGMVRVRALVPKFARSNETVLITGESGVGKEHVAALLHRLDTRRSQKPFYAINCAAMQDTLIESELFGHERGAFTGAVRLTRGAFERAEGGTLFLDEIGELSASAQAKLLRVLQEKAFRRVGGDEMIAFTCRVVAATNRPIFERAQAGEFRADLLYRVNPLHLHIPALRDRRDEILPLARGLLAARNRASDEQPKVLSASCEAALMTHDWPGNIRELKNAIGRAHLIAGARVIDRRHLFEDMALIEDNAGNEDPEVDLAMYMSQQERAFLVEQLNRHGWRIIETAQSIGISRKGLWEKMRRYAINEPPLDERPFAR